MLEVIHVFADIPSGWAEVTAAALDAIPTVVTIALGVGAVVVGPRWSRKLKKIQAASETSAFHTANAHVDDEDEPINLRDDLDAKFQSLEKRFDRQDERLDNIEDHISTLHGRDLEHERRLNRGSQRMDDLERTIPKSPYAPPPDSKKEEP